MSNSRFIELVSVFLQQNALVLAHEDPSELVVTVGDTRIRLSIADDDDNDLICIAEFIDEATCAELMSQPALERAFKLNYEAYHAEDFRFAIDPQGQPVLLASFALPTLAPDALTAIVTHAQDSASLHRLIVTTPHKKQDASHDIPLYSLKA